MRHFFHLFYEFNLDRGSCIGRDRLFRGQSKEIRVEFLSLFPRSFNGYNLSEITWNSKESIEYS